MSTHCHKCNKETPANKNFCPYCGEKQIISTDHASSVCICGKELDNSKKFCATCGASNPLFAVKKEESKQQIQSTSHCDCGSEYPKTGKFCVKCGKPVHTQTRTEEASPVETEVLPAQTAQPTEQIPHTQKKKKSGRKFLRYAAMFLLICGVGAGGYYAFTQFFGGVKKTLLIEQKIVPGEEDQVIKFKDDIQVTVPFGLIDKEETLSISSVRGLPNAEGMQMFDAYDVHITNITELDGFIEITLNYNSSKIPSGMSASQALTCMYYNESTSNWEPIPHMIDEQNKQMTVYTPHLSIFAPGVVRNKVEPDPMMKIQHVSFPSGNMMEESEVIETLNRYGGGGGGSTTGQGLVAGWEFVNEWFGIAAQVSTFAENALEVGALSGCNQIVTEIGIGFALIQAAIDYSSGKKDKAVLELTKNVGNYVTLKIFSTTAMNVAFVGVFAIDYSLNKFATTAISGRNQIYIDAYSLYYQEKRKNEKINSVWWYKKLKGLARKSKNPAESGDLVKKFLTDYVWEFWKDETTVAAYMDRVTKGHGFTGGGGLNEKLKTDISNNQLAEIVHVLNETGIFERIIKELRIEAQGRLYDQLCIVKDKLNIEYKIKVIAKPDPDSPEYKDIEVSGLDVRFVVSNPTHTDLWKGTTNSDGEMDFKCTALGYVDAGAPVVVEIDVPSPADKKKVDTFSGEMKLGSSGKTTIVEIQIGAPKLEGIWKIEGVCKVAKLDASFSGIDAFAEGYDYVMYGSKQNYDDAKRETEKAMIGQKSELPNLEMDGIEYIWKVSRQGEYYIIESPTFSNPESLGGSKYKIRFTGKDTFEGEMETNGNYGGKSNYLKYDVNGSRIR
jgi:hypothetical protein